MPGKNEEPNAPYIPFRTFLNLIIKMEEGVPQRLDKSFLTGQAGGLHQPIIAAFRYFGFVDDAGFTQPSLDKVATSGEQRDEYLAGVWEDAYEWANRLGENATQAQLDEAFKEHTGLTGSSLRKAVTFYLHGARHLGNPLSKHFSAPRPAQANAGKARRSIKRGTPTAKGARRETEAPRKTANLNPVVAALVDALVQQLESGKAEFDGTAFDSWVAAFKAAVPLWSSKGATTK